MKKHCILAAFSALLTPGLASAALVAWYPLDSDANDASGNGFNGAVVGSTVTFGQTGASGSTGDSASFGTGGHIDVPFNSALNPASYTVTLWANASTNAGFTSPITSRDDIPATNVNGFILYNDSAGEWEHWTGTGGGAGAWDRLDGGAATASTWTHLAISYDAGTSTKSLYVNGSLVASNSSAYVPNGVEDLHIGGGGDTGTEFTWSGNIDDVTIWDESLDAAAIGDIMTNSIPEPGALALFGLSGLMLFARRRRTGM